MKMKEKDTPILEIGHLSVAFESYDARLEKISFLAISDLSITLMRGEILAIVGSSGSGKSLLAHAVVDILPDNAKVGGSIAYKGEALTSDRIKKLRGSEIAFIPQSVAFLDPLMRVGDQVVGTMGEAARESQKKAFAHYGLKPEVAGDFPFQLSGGMARRVLLSTALVSDAELVIADEPTPGLDLEIALEALADLRVMADDGRSVILITHDIDLALNVADKIAIFHDGRVVETASVKDFSGDGTGLVHPYSRALFRALPQNGFQLERCRECGATSATWKIDEHGMECDHSSGVEQTERSDEKKNSPLRAEQIGGGRLEVRGVSFRYGDGPMILKDVSFSAEPGERVAILGPSGYGKSTLAGIIAGYLRPLEGEVLWDGRPLPQSGFCPIQLIYQHPENALDPRRMMYDSLCEAGEPSPDVLRETGIHSKWYRRWPGELSGGELQRFCVARVIKPQTKMLIADEMTTMLDALNQAHIWNFVLDHAKRTGMSVLAITHNRHLAERVADRIIKIPELNRIEVDRADL